VTEANVAPFPATETATGPGVAKPDAILRIDGLHRAFGGVVAVDVDHLEIQRGAITALIGPNGAGKSTLFNLVTGFDTPDRGQWQFDGHDLRGLPSHRVARLGMVRNFQLTKALARLTVLDNMLVAAPNQPGESFLGSWARASWRRREEEIHERATELLTRFSLADKAGDRAGSLSGGQRKLLDVARALMTEPTMICLDEPMAGVNPALTQSLLHHITSLRDQGLTVVFVEHDMDVVMEISDWVVVLAQGRVIAEAPPSAIVADEAVIEAYLGEPPRPVEELDVPDLPRAEAADT
jgi:neutral amino acid transport system ATP-binding protein